MNKGIRFRVTYTYQRSDKQFDIYDRKLSRSDVFADICVREHIILGLGVPSLTFEQIAQMAGVRDMSYRVVHPHEFIR